MKVTLTTIVIAFDFILLNYILYTGPERKTIASSTNLHIIIINLRARALFQYRYGQKTMGRNNACCITLNLFFEI